MIFLSLSLSLYLLQYFSSFLLVFLTHPNSPLTRIYHLFCSGMGIIPTFSLMVSFIGLSCFIWAFIHINFAYRQQQPFFPWLFYGLIDDSKKTNRLYSVPIWFNDEKRSKCIHDLDHWSLQSDQISLSLFRSQLSLNGLLKVFIIISNTSLLTKLPDLKMWITLPYVC